MKVILSHSGKQHSYNIAHQLMKFGALKIFITSSYIKWLFLQRLLRLLKEDFFSKRFLIGLGGSYVNSNWRFEVKEFFLKKLHGINLRTKLAVYERDKAFDKYVCNYIKKQDFDIFWGFQGSCLNSIVISNKLNKITICEQATIYYPFYSKIIQEEIQLNPEWEDSMLASFYPDDHLERLIVEPKIADYVFVASTFSKKSLLDEGINEAKVKVLPLGTDMSNIEVPSDRQKRKPLKVLFVGRVTQEKGIKYLLEAVKFLGDSVELTIIGKIQGSGKALQEYNGYYTYRAFIKHEDLLNTYKDYDVLVNPSLFEGFGFVILEAMASGIPVIATYNSFGPEIIKDCENGFLVPIRDTDAIINSLLKVQNMSDNDYAFMCKLAHSAAKDFTWDKYRIRLENLLNEIPRVKNGE